MCERVCVWARARVCGGGGGGGREGVPLVFLRFAALQFTRADWRTPCLCALFGIGSIGSVVRWIVGRVNLPRVPFCYPRLHGSVYLLHRMMAFLRIFWPTLPWRVRLLRPAPHTGTVVSG